MSTQRNMLLTLTRQALGIGLRLGSTVVIARALGPLDNGRYALALLLPTLLAGALNLGVPAANAHYIARNQLSLARACRMNAALWLALCALGALLTWPAARFMPELAPGTELIAGGLFAVTLASSFAAGLLQGAGDFAGFNRGLLIAPLSAASVAIALACAGWLNLPRALLVQLTAELASLFYLLWALRPHLRVPLAAADDLELTRLLRFGGLAHLSTLLMLLNYRTDLLMIEWLIGPAAVGIYVIAVRIAEQLWIVSQSISTVLLPAVSAQGDATPLIASASRTALWLSAALALAIALLHPLLMWLFGPSYRPAALPLLLLLPGATLLGGARIAGVAMTALGKPQRNLLIALAVLLCNVPLNLLLIPRWGERGAACATSLAYAAGTLVALVQLMALTDSRLRDFVLPTAHDLDRGKRLLRGLFSGHKN